MKLLLVMWGLPKYNHETAMQMVGFLYLMWELGTEHPNDLTASQIKLYG
jgi:hypothetical protein